MSTEPSEHDTEPDPKPQKSQPDSTVRQVLWTLCAAVFCERFCFFLLISVLVLFLNERCGYEENLAVKVYGLFISGCYLMPLVGGRLCDGVLGPIRTTLLGMMVQTAGFLMLHIAALVPLALVLIAVGTGLFKAGTQTLLGCLDVSSEVQQNRLFSTIYILVNVAALLAPMAAGLLPSGPNYQPLLLCMLLCAALCLASLWSLRTATLDRTQAEPGHQVQHPATTKRGLRLLLLLLAGALFAAGFVQSHSTLLLFVRDHVDRNVGPYIIPVAWFGAGPSAMVLLTSPVLATAFTILRGRNREPTTMQKLAVGMIITALAFVPICGAVYQARVHHTVSPAWVMSCFTLLAIGEILVVALAPAEIARIAPIDHRGRWMSYWFVATAIGNAIGGWVEW
jgi:POT family proton-dependent oligopeptide transporter